VRRQLDETHRRLIDFIQRAPEDQLSRETLFRRRLRLDTYAHYPQHAEAIRNGDETFWCGEQPFEEIVPSTAHKYGDQFALLPRRGR